MKKTSSMIMLAMFALNSVAGDFVDRFEKKALHDKNAMKTLTYEQVILGVTDHAVASGSAVGIGLVDKKKTKMWKELLPKVELQLERETREFETARKNYLTHKSMLEKLYTEKKLAIKKSVKSEQVKQISSRIEHLSAKVELEEKVMQKELKDKARAIKSSEKARAHILKAYVLPNGSKVPSSKIAEIQKKLKLFKVSKGAFTVLGVAAGVEFMIRVGLLTKYDPGALPLVDGVSYILEEINENGAEPRVKRGKTMHKLFSAAYGERYYTDPEVISNSDLGKDLEAAQSYRKSLPARDLGGAIGQ